MEDQGFDDLQRQAILHDEGPLMVLAGPGTGKTRILVERVRRLANEGTPPEAICLVTFTRKAADEIKNRLRKNLGSVQVKHMMISTLHSLALKIMIANERRSGNRIPDVADPAECYALLRRAIKELQIDTAVFSPLDIWRDIQAWKASAERDLSLLVYKIQEVARRYQQILASEHKWDLADLVMHASMILREVPQIASAFSSLRYLMVDEFQDTAIAEYRFLKLLMGSRANLMLVAAAAQSIYAWRGADFTCLRALVCQDHPDMQVIVLRENYRCGQDIIEVAAAMVPEEDEVQLRGNRGSGLVLFRALPDNHAEANFIAGTILALQERGFALSQLAVLFRSWFQASMLEQVMVARQIPYFLSSDQQKLYERREIREMIAYLQVIHAMQEHQENMVDMPALHGALDLIVNTPPRGIGQRSIQMIRGSAAEISMDALVHACIRQDLREQVRLACGDLLELLGQLSREEDLRPAALIDQIIERTGWIQHLQNDLEGRQAINRLRTLQQEAADHPKIGDFLASMGSRISFKLDQAGVVLSTIHAAKGLEWPVVFLAGFNQGILPSDSALRSAFNGDPLEERHVAHVALSRARDLLVLSWFDERVMEDGSTLPYRRSSFISLIPKERMYEHRSDNDLPMRGVDGFPDGDHTACTEEYETAAFG